MEWKNNYSGGQSSVSRLLILMLCLSSVVAQAQWKNTYDDVTGYFDHNHYSNELWGEGTILAGTMFEPGDLTNTMVHLMEVDLQGGIVWENTYDFGSDQRCFDVCVVSEEMVAITGIANNMLFVSLIGSGGSVVKTTYYDRGQSLGSVGLSIIFSEATGSLFVGGYAAQDVFDHTMSQATGLLLSLDPGLTLNWARELSNIEEIVMVNDLTELPGHGVFLTGKLVDQDTVTSMLSTMYDYSGSMIWDESFREFSNTYVAGANAVYDAQADELFVLITSDNTFGIQKLGGVSGPSPSVIYVVTYTPGDNYAGFDIEIDPNDDDLLVAGLKHSQPASTNNSPTFMAKLDRTNATALWLKMIDADNIDYRMHDYDIFQAFYITYPYISHPDILTIVDQNTFQTVGYESNLINQAYGVTLFNTDTSGNIPSFSNCQQSTMKGYFVMDTQAKSYISNVINPNVVQKKIIRRDREHQPVSRCASDCNVTIDDIVTQYVSCYTHHFSPAITTSTNGTVLYYDWNWGDGSTGISTGDTTHQFSQDSCSYNVCVSVTFMSTTGDICTDTLCETVLMLNEPSCGPCGETPGSGFNKGQAETSTGLSWEVYPNPATDQVTVQFDDEVSNGTLHLYNATGVLVKQMTVSNTRQVQMDVGELPVGLYSLQLTGDDETKLEMVIIK